MRVRLDALAFLLMGQFLPTFLFPIYAAAADNAFCGTDPPSFFTVSIGDCHNGDPKMTFKPLDQNIKYYNSNGRLLNGWPYFDETKPRKRYKSTDGKSFEADEERGGMWELDGDLHKRWAFDYHFQDDKLVKDGGPDDHRSKSLLSAKIWFLKDAVIKANAILEAQSRPSKSSTFVDYKGDRYYLTIEPGKPATVNEFGNIESGTADRVVVTSDKSWPLVNQSGVVSY